MKSTFFQDVSEASPIRQGDVIVRAHAASDTSASEEELGVIITADCDIAQEKMGPFYTYVSLVSAKHYVEQIWSTEELEKLKEKYRNLAIDFIYDLDRRRDPAVRRMGAQELLDWIQDDGIDQILNAVCKVTNRREGGKQILTTFALAEDAIRYYPTPLSRLQACWKAIGRRFTEQQGFVRSALNQRQMRSECILIPSLPGHDGIGFVVNLRDIRSIAIDHVYTNRIDYRLGDTTDGMYRIGRFSDFIRFGISQRLGILFSRIGMTREYEDECAIIGDLITGDLISESVSLAED